MVNGKNQRRLTGSQQKNRVKSKVTVTSRNGLDDECKQTSSLSAKQMMGCRSRPRQGQINHQLPEIPEGGSEGAGSAVFENPGNPPDPDGDGGEQAMSIFNRADGIDMSMDVTMGFLSEGDGEHEEEGNH